MSAFQFPDPNESTTAYNELTGVTYFWVADPGKWVVANTGTALPEPITDETLPYRLTVGERDGETGEDIAAFQIFETIILKDALGNNLGDVAFESAGGIGVALDNTFDYPVIKIQANTIQDKTRYNESRIYAEELRNGITYKTYNIVNRTGIPTNRQGEISVDQQRASAVSTITFGDTSAEGYSIGSVSVGDTLCITKIDQGRKYFYKITSGFTNSGTYGVEFIEAGSWYGTANVTQNPHYLEVFKAPQPEAAEESVRDLEAEVDQNEEQLQAVSTNLMNALFQLQAAGQTIEELKARISALENA